MAEKVHIDHLQNYLRRQTKTNNGKKKNEEVTKTKKSDRLQNKSVLESRGSTKSAESVRKPPLPKAKPGRWSINDILPDDAFLHIFGCLSTSDLLRIMSVCKLWMNLLLDCDIWRVRFRRLPKYVQTFSKLAQMPKKINWRKEFIHSCKLAREDLVQQKLKKKVDGLPTKTMEAIKFLDIRWLLVIEDRDGNAHTSLSKEVFFFSTSLSIRWSDVRISEVKSIKKLTLLALCPILFSKKGVLSSESVCTRSIINQYSFEDGLFLPMTETIKSDNHVSLYFLDNFVFGIWNEQQQHPRKDDLDLAFISCSQHFHDGLIKKIFMGSSTTRYTENHKPYLDDINPMYGLRGYSGSLTVRNNRSVIWETKYREFYDHDWKDDVLLISHTREKDYSFYEINKEYEFSWKTAALKGKIQDTCIIDFTLLDENKKPLWCFSRPAFIGMVEKEQCDVTYDFNDGEVAALNISDEKKRTFELLFMRDKKAGMSSIVKVEVGLPKSFINDWFGTRY